MFGTQRIIIVSALLFAHCTQIDLSEQLSTAICSDNFDRDDANTLGNHWEISGINNTANPITTTVASQKASVTLPTVGGRFAYISCSQKVEQTKTKVSAKFIPKVSFSTSKAMGLVARAQNKATLSDAYVCALEYTGVGQLPLSLYKGVNTARQDLASSNILTVIGGSEYLLSLSLSLSGNQLTCSVSGAATTEVSITDTTFATGYVGVFALSQAGGANMDFTFDDFKTEVRP